MNSSLLRLSRAFCALLFVSASVSAQGETTLLSVFVDQPDGSELVDLELARDLQLSIDGQDELGWPVSVRIGGQQSALLPKHCDFELPRGVRVRLSLYAPPHPLIERVIELDPEAEQQQVHLTLAPPVPMRSLGVIVNFPQPAPTPSSRFLVKLIAPLTGHVLYRSGVAEARGGLRAADGTYEVSIEGAEGSMLGDGPPAPHWLVPARKIVEVKDIGAQVAARNGVWVTLDPQWGARMKLQLAPCAPGAESPNLNASESSSEPARPVLFQWIADDPRDFFRVQLESLNGEEIHDLTWGWPALPGPSPRALFPRAEDVYLVDSVPSGEYELVLRGRSIQELRQRITLVDREVLNLKLEPRAQR